MDEQEFEETEETMGSTGEAEEASEEPEENPMADLLGALQLRVDGLEEQISLLRDSIATVVEGGAVIREEGEEEEKEDETEDEYLLLEDLDYS